MNAKRNTKGPDDRTERPAMPKPSFAGRLRTYFLTGLIVTAPIAITVYLAWSFVAFVDDRISPLIPQQYNPETYLKFSVPGLGIVVIGVGLMLVGFLTANFVGHMLIRSGERRANQATGSVSPETFPGPGRPKRSVPPPATVSPARGASRGRAVNRRFR